MLNNPCCVICDFSYIAREFNFPLKEMIQSNFSSRHYGVSGEAGFGSERLPVGPALLAVFGLSLLGWACALVPLVSALSP